MNSCNNKRPSINHFSPRLTRQQHRKNLAELVLPIVFSSGALFLSECWKVVPLVCKRWREIFLDVLPSWPSGAQIKIVSFFNFPPPSPMYPVVFEIAFTELNSWIQDHTAQKLAASPRFLCHIFEKLEEIRCSQMSSKERAEQPACWGCHAQLAIIRTCFFQGYGALSIIFAEQMHPQESFGPYVPWQGPRFTSCVLGGIPSSKPYWKCVISLTNFQLLDYTIHSQQQQCLEEHEIENGMCMWVEEA